MHISHEHDINEPYDGSTIFDEVQKVLAEKVFLVKPTESKQNKHVNYRLIDPPYIHTTDKPLLYFTILQRHDA